MMDAYTEKYYEYVPRQVGKSERLSRAIEIEKIERKVEFVELVRNRCVESTFSEVAVGEELR